MNDHKTNVDSFGRNCLEILLNSLSNEHILIIGGTGSLGVHLLETMIPISSSAQISVISRDENKQWHLKRKFVNVNFFLGDIRNKERIRDLFMIIQPSIVILAAALKHIDQCETQMEECIATNILGIENVLQVCIDFDRKCSSSSSSFHLKSVLFISTDKACSPINVYGMSKSISERFVTQIASKYNSGGGLKAKYLCVRYGNVINSRGSIIPKLIELSNDSKIDFLPLTDPRMTRFFMTLNQSVEIILHALIFGNSGETWIPEVQAVKIIDLMNYFATKFNKKIQIVGVRPGEKLHECLINETESFRTIKQYITETKKTFYVLQSSLKTNPNCNHDLEKLQLQYTSANVTNFSFLKSQVDAIL